MEIDSASPSPHHHPSVPSANSWLNQDGNTLSLTNLQQPVPSTSSPLPPSSPSVSRKRRRSPSSFCNQYPNPCHTNTADSDNPDRAQSPPLKRRNHSSLPRHTLPLPSVHPDFQSEPTSHFPDVQPSFNRQDSHSTLETVASMGQSPMEYGADFGSEGSISRSASVGATASDTGMDSPMHTMRLQSPSNSDSAHTGNGSRRDDATGIDKMTSVRMEEAELVKSDDSMGSPSSCRSSPEASSSLTGNRWTSIRPEESYDHVYSSRAESTPDSFNLRRSSQGLNLTIASNNRFHAPHVPSPLASTEFPRSHPSSGLMETRTNSSDEDYAIANDDINDASILSDLARPRTPTSTHFSRLNSAPGMGGGMGSSKKQHSPGLGPTTPPGGKQMLRFTLGFRDDCELCRKKTPGHYSHVVHRRET
ncbi:hypothetical protein IE53DRAFT_383187 [Violaceomyces palustris]|uniref:Uncharacterized protein n=1 Tax=Violaceomyces palustris TaxID=1673888 RepID=A0ACD0P877_9BASI|nr:hypothetical protein IE53DRAFT_383187 [Violaceomyces palustris]